MTRIPFLLLALCLLTHCESSAPSADNPVEGTEELMETTTTGGDTTARAIDLNFLPLDLKQRHYLVFRQRLPLVDMPGFLYEEGKALREKAAANGVKATGPATALFYDWDTDSRMGEAAVALPVAEGTTLPPYVLITLPAQFALALDLAGPYDGLGAMHYALESEIVRRGLRADLPTVEEYLVGPKDTDDPANYQTRITYLLK